MKWLDALRVKPWLPAIDRPELEPQHGLIAMSGQRVGLAIFLVVVASLFMLFTVSYQLRMDYQDWRPVAEPWQLWMNTLFLLLGSVALQMASKAASQSQQQRTDKLFKIAGLFTWAFVFGQLWAWLAMRDAGYNVESNPANSFFYLITGVHGAHIIGGLMAWLKTVLRMRSGGDAQSIRLSIQLCTTYWHFLLVIWLFLFYMLLVT